MSSSLVVSPTIVIIGQPTVGKTKTELPHAVTATMSNPVAGVVYEAEIYLIDEAGQYRDEILSGDTCAIGCSYSGDDIRFRWSRLIIAQAGLYRLQVHVAPLDSQNRRQRKVAAAYSDAIRVQD